jgi:5,10-methylenetetrahydromethanopterin reductase
METTDMRIGLMIGATAGDNSLNGVIKTAQDAEAAGFVDVWLANIFGLDAITTLALIGRETSHIGLGTAVTPSYPRHPSAIAQQALTTAAAAPGRFNLGIGLSHKVVIEDMLGFSYDKPARHMREYLQVLAPLLRGEQVAFNGEEYRVNLGLNVPDAGHVPLLVAALGPVMLKLTGEVADGTVTWMTGPETLENHIIPKLGAGASAAGKPSPATVAGFPVTLTNDVDAGRKHVGETLAMYGTLPSYRAMLDREGVAGPADLALVGDEAQLRQELSRLKNIGVTHFCAAISGETEEVRERTSQFLSAEA